MFERFIGYDCARARSGDVWCKESDDRFHKMPFPKGTIAVTNRDVMRYLLTDAGQVYVHGKFIPDEGHERIDYSTPHAVPELTDVVELQNGPVFVFLLHRDGVVNAFLRSNTKDDSAGPTLRFRETNHTRIEPGPVKRMFIGRESCFALAREIRCSPTLSRLTPTLPVPLGVPVDQIDDLLTLEGFYALTRSGDVLRWPSTSLFLEPTRTGSTIALPAKPLLSSIRIMRASGGSYLAIARDGDLYFGPDSLFPPRILRVFGKVVDVSRALCAITVTGRLICAEHASFRYADDRDDKPPVDAKLAKDTDPIPL